MSNYAKHLLETLWKKHYHAGTTGNYHGDMAAAFDAISRDPECTLDVAQLMRRATAVHMELERKPEHQGRKWFCERFGLPHEMVTQQEV